MADMLSDGLAWLAAQQKLHQSVDVVYRRGADSVELKVTLGRTGQRLTGPDGGVRIRKTDLDILVPVADLVLDDTPVTPLAGDLVDLTRSGTTKRYEVAPLDGQEPEFQTDEHGIRYRIHLKFWKEV